MLIEDCFISFLLQKQKRERRLLPPLPQCSGFPESLCLGTRNGLPGIPAAKEIMLHVATTWAGEWLVVQNVRPGVDPTDLVSVGPGPTSNQEFHCLTSILDLSLLEQFIEVFEQPLHSDLHAPGGCHVHHMAPAFYSVRHVVTDKGSALRLVVPCIAYDGRGLGARDQADRSGIMGLEASLYAQR